MFSTSSYDGKLKIWDTENLQAVASFSLDKVFCHSYSHILGNESLISAGLNSLIRLCDIRSGSSAQCFKCHKGPVISIKWSPSNQYSFFSAGNDGFIYGWDIRRSGVLTTLSHDRSKEIVDEFRQCHAVKDIIFSSSHEILSLTSHTKNSCSLSIWDIDSQSNRPCISKFPSNGRYIQRLEYCELLSSSFCLVPAKDKVIVWSPISLLSWEFTSPSIRHIKGLLSDLRFFSTHNEYGYIEWTTK